MKSSKTKSVIRAVIIIISIALLSIGLADNGFRDVKNKAIRICYECMGIG